jgi:hypothetical protein
MHTSIVLLALTGLAAPAEGTSPTWLNDYSQARRLGADQNKPLAVFLSPGKENWGKRAMEGEQGKEVRRLLASHYVCVSINTSTEAGRRLAEAFEMAGGKGIILSDRSGAVQAFRHEGELTNGDLGRYLARHSTTDRATTTETVTTARTSNYYDPAPTTQGWTQPSYGYFSGGFGGGFGGCSS